jgi:L-Ala-D/L-Glu epimerase
LELHSYTYQLRFRHPFVLSVGTRTHTPAVFTEISENGLTGYGEATLPPYLYDTQESVMKFLAGLKLKDFSLSAGIDPVLSYLGSLPPGNHPAKAAVDMALHDLWGRIQGQSVSQLWGIQEETVPLCTYTIAADDPASLPAKLEEGRAFHLYKIKLGGRNDKAIVEALVSATAKPFCVDVNQGWADREMALDTIHWLHSKGAVLVEQPLPKNRWDDMAWITARSPIPTVADEAVRTLADLDQAQGAFSGINIKLMKSTGLAEGRRMALRARELGMKVLIGCMSESSCGVSAATHLTPYADWADLDGPFLISNDPFVRPALVDGRIEVSRTPGTGAVKIR